MIRAFALASLLFSAGTARADEPKPVSLEATVAPSPARGFGPVLRVRLVGVAKETAVVTDGLSVKVNRTDKTATVVVTIPEVRDEKGRLVVPSANKLGVVRLQAGEVASVHVPHSPELQQALKAAAAGEVELVIEYEVSEAWGKRFGVASGRVRETATVTK